jgi:hypothetical protein
LNNPLVEPVPSQEKLFKMLTRLMLSTADFSKYYLNSLAHKVAMNIIVFCFLMTLQWYIIMQKFHLIYHFHVIHTSKNYCQIPNLVILLEIMFQKLGYGDASNNENTNLLVA